MIEALMDMITKDASDKEDLEFVCLKCLIKVPTELFGDVTMSEKQAFEFKVGDEVKVVTEGIFAYKQSGIIVDTTTGGYYVKFPDSIGLGYFSSHNLEYVFQVGDIVKILYDKAGSDIGKVTTITKITEAGHLVCPSPFYPSAAPWIFGRYDSEVELVKRVREVNQTPAPAPQSEIETQFKVGDKVGWNSHPGYGAGVITALNLESKTPSALVYHWGWVLLIDLNLLVEKTIKDKPAKLTDRLTAVENALEGRSVAELSRELYALKDYVTDIVTPAIESLRKDTDAEQVPRRPLSLSNLVQETIDKVESLEERLLAVEKQNREFKTMHELLSNACALLSKHQEQITSIEERL